MNIILVGGGQVGSYIAHLLLENGCDVTIIEQRKSVLEKLYAELPREVVLEGDGTSPKALKKAGIANADVLVAVTGADETNLVSSTIAKFEFAVPRVIARVNNPKNKWLFNESMGVDVEFSQANILAHLVVEEIDLKNMITLLKLNKGENSIISLTVEHGSSAVGRAIKELEIPNDSILIAIDRNNEIVIPRGDTVVEEQDHILALTNEKDEVELSAVFAAQI
ncbi:MAG: potassium channel family protein [Lachnospiraceae bacterium]